MKSVARFAVVTVLVLAFSSAWAGMVGIGLHGGVDMTRIEEKVYTFQFEDDPIGMNSTLTREESTQPFNFGIDVTIGAIPVIDLMISADVAIAPYKIYFNPPHQFSALSQSKQFGYARMGGDVSVLYNVVKLPPMAKVINVFVGAGLGMHAFTPIFNEETLKNQVKSADEEFKLEDLEEDIEAKIGLHFLGGIKFKPPVIPFGIKIIAKYYIIPGQADETPDSYLNLLGGLSFEI